jgi:hypothetical protein
MSGIHGGSAGGGESPTNKDASGGYVGLTEFKINIKNALGTITSFLQNANTLERTYTLQNRDGTIADDTDLALKADITYVDSLVSGVLRDRGNYDSSVNTYPASGGSGAAGAIKKGDLWYISVAGTLGGTAVNVGDTVRALADTPGQTAGNWAVMENNLGYVPERSIDAASAKTTPVDADTMGLIDSAASNVLKKVTWANIKATLKTYFDTLYGGAITITTQSLSGLSGYTFTGLTGKKQIKIFYSLCDMGNSARVRLQLRYGGSTFKTTSYTCEIIEAASTVSQTNFNTGFYGSKSASATAINSGTFVLDLVDPVNNRWTCSMLGLQNLGGTKYNIVMWGEVTLGSGNALDAVKFEDEAGNVFDAGSPFAACTSI